MDAATAIVLAGGRSARLGTDKALVRVGGLPVLRRVTDVLAALTEDIVLVEAPGAPRDLPPLGLAPRRVQDDTPGRGPLAGLAAGLRAARGAYAWAVACDMPFLDPRLLLRLLSVAPGWDAVVPAPGGVPQPLCAVYASGCLPAIDAALAGGNPGPRHLLELLRVRVLDDAELRALGVEEHAFLSINTLDDLHCAERLAACGESWG